ncbi:MAG: PAS domain S-box protein [Desulfobacterales bacterium]
MDILSNFFDQKAAIVGAGNLCARFLEHFFNTNQSEKKPEIIGVADKNPAARGIVLANTLGIYTTMDYREFAHLEGLQIILEMSNDPMLSDVIASHMPDHVRVIDHYEARTLFELLLVQEFRNRGYEKIRTGNWDLGDIKNIHDQVMTQFAKILENKNQRTRQIVRDLWEQQETVSQIIQGNTIPTFVIDRTHKVIHWNTALERLTGISAADVVGTDRQWSPFYAQKRPTMADFIVEQTDEAEIGQFYDESWSRSALIKGAYQAEGFFKHIGENGKWLFFTAAPIQSRNGEMIGAIETFWDTTEDKRRIEEQAHYTRELSTLVELYTALNAPVDFEKRLDNALSVVSEFIDANNVCIFLKDENQGFCLRYKSGNCNYTCSDAEHAAMTDMIAKIADTGQLTIYEKKTHPYVACPFFDEKIQSLIYVPVSDKENNPLGVIHVTSRHPIWFIEQEKDILELIGNRIGVAIENALLQEQYVKSEEKYRTLFNNDPTPIFILEKDSWRIIDINQRAKDTYGYDLDELSGTPFTALGDPEDDEIIDGMANITTQHSVLFSKKRHYRKGGELFYVTIVVSAAEYGGKDILIANTTDITEITEKEAQLIQAGKMTTLGVMAAGMAHEINQPLNVIQICADYFLKMHNKGENIPPSDFKARVMNIIENVDRASKVIRRVRDFARQTDVTRSKININAPIRDSIKVLDHALKTHQIGLLLELEENMPPIMADHNRLEQVLINLITNAIDAIEEKVQKHPDKSVDKIVTIKSNFACGDVSVTVSDTGAGMSDQVQEKIFEPFFTTKETGKGTGLGVSISYGIIKDYDGKIEVNSTVDAGTSIKITFPAAGTPQKET